MNAADISLMAESARLTNDAQQGNDESEVALINTKRVLRLAQDNHHSAENRLPRHDWIDWYAPFIVATEAGRSVADAARLADESVCESLWNRVTR